MSMFFCTLPTNRTPGKRVVGDPSARFFAKVGFHHADLAGWGSTGGGTKHPILPGTEFGRRAVFHGAVALGSRHLFHDQPPPRCRPAKDLG